MDERNDYNSIPKIENVEEVFRVNQIYFSKPSKNKRKVLLVLIWWSVKQYFKTLKNK